LTVVRSLDMVRPPICVDPQRGGDELLGSCANHQDLCPPRIPANSELSMLSFLREFWMFLRVRKKYWLIPTFLVMLIFGGLVVLTQGSAVAPFIYAIF
jgi:hypothetical protein